MSPVTRYIGKPLRRSEDLIHVTGRGSFVDDFSLPGMLYGALVRSPYAHARVLRVNFRAAEKLQGVVAVYTAEHLGELAGPLPPSVSPLPTYPVRYKTHYTLAVGKVRYVGEPVAFVVASSPYIARDAVDLVEVEYEPLDPVVDVEKAVQDSSALVHDDMANNVAAEKVVSVGDYEEAARGAALVVNERLVYNRGGGQSIEPRAVMAHYERRSGSLTVWDSTQAPIPIRNGLASLLGLPESQIRVIAPDVGGGFGPKIMLFYPEEVLVPLAAMRLGRPVKWVETRSEYSMCANQERHQIHYVEAAFSGDGELLGLKDNFLVDTGAYTPYGVMVPIITMCTMPGPYRLRNMWFHFRSVFTNKTIVSPVRGAGRPTAVFVMERVLDKAAREMGMGRDAIRRVNLIHPSEMPWETGLIYQDGAPNTYDTGNYPAVLEKLLHISKFGEWERIKDEMTKSAKRVGFGLALYVEGAGVGPYEMARVKVGVDGKVYVATGVGSQGQGHFTSLAQVAGELLGIDPRNVEVHVGDTMRMEWGVGTFASRSAAVSASAVHQAAMKVREKILRLASKLLEAKPEDIELTDGKVHVRGVMGIALTLDQLAKIAAPLRGTIDEEPGLDAVAFFSPRGSVYSSGGCAVMCEVDEETGGVKVIKVWLVHDCGKLINPMIVEGQIHGGVAMGLGSVLLEEIVHDENGIPLATTFADYLIPSASDIPSEITVEHIITSTNKNPLGAKGVGEAGVIPIAAAIASAVDDAFNNRVFVRAAPIKSVDILKMVREVR
ncbi:MAG: xanthine dehydrogenase family protein molybdopterin-binding subunit [Nitrososphaerota archaeon]